MDWFVMCRVSGGVTGTRMALLKADGQTQRFGSQAEAQAEADRLNAKMNNRYSVADFRYWPVSEDAGAGWEDTQRFSRIAW